MLRLRSLYFSTLGIKSIKQARNLLINEKITSPTGLVRLIKEGSSDHVPLGFAIENAEKDEKDLIQIASEEIKGKRIPICKIYSYDLAKKEAYAYEKNKKPPQKFGHKQLKISGGIGEADLARKLDQLNTFLQSNQVTVDIRTPRTRNKEERWTKEDKLKLVLKMYKKVLDETKAKEIETQRKTLKDGIQICLARKK